jgi:hypothetical protein
MITWIKNNKLAFVLILIVLYLLSQKILGISTTSFGIPSISDRSTSYSALNSVSLGSKSTGGMAYGSYQTQEAAPTTNPNRLVVQDTRMSLVVKDVGDIINKIQDLTVRFGGFMVNSELSKPSESGSGSITIRVPEEKRNEALEVFRKLSVKVISESVSGIDVTDQYSDLNARLVVLNQTKTKFEDILNKATAVQDLLNVQRELINLQAQIDQVVGQQKYLEQTAKLTKITVYLSTDELSLPYAPDNAWRPAVIFKEAVRSLVSTIRGIGTLAIWAVVFIPVLVPVLVIIWLIRRRNKVRI